MLRSIAVVLEINIAVPDHTTLSRRGDGLRTLLSELTALSHFHLLVDSTGRKVYGKGEWSDWKRHPLAPSLGQLHLGVDANTHADVAVELTSHDVDDISESNRSMLTLLR